MAAETALPTRRATSSPLLPELRANTIKTFKCLTTPWRHYACDWSLNSNNFCTLAFASVLPQPQNHITIASLPTTLEESSEFTYESEVLTVDYVATKLAWSPCTIKGSEYLAASGDGVYIWKRGDSTNDGSRCTLTGRLLSRHPSRRYLSEDPIGTSSTTTNGNPPAPITSFDWNRLDPTLLVTASYDTTCAVWCLDTGTIKTQLIAHDKEVFDVAFSPVSTDSFVSVGADGSLRLFDIRTLDHSTIIYESPDATPLLKVSWNPNDSNYLATFALDSHKVIIMDIRMPSIPAAQLGDHQNSIVSAKWSPLSSSQIMTADSRKLNLWDLSDPSTPAFSLDTFNGITGTGDGGMELDPSPIQNIIWPQVHSDWIAISSQNNISVLRL